MALCVQRVGLIAAICLSGLPSFAAEATSPQGLDPAIHSLAEASIRVTHRFEDEIWPGWGATPFDLLVIDGETEFLAAAEKPANGGFTPRLDTLGGRPLFERTRVYPPRLLATFPATGGASTIVIGTPEGAEISTGRWMFTIAHEHFHQYQNFAPGYYAKVAALDLTGGDTSGMWMLNYPFPYADASVSKLYASAAEHLKGAYEAIDRPDFEATVVTYLRARERLKAILEPADYSYFAFQVWQEGIARYTEYEAALAASAGIEPLGGGVSPSDAAARARDLLDNSLATLADSTALGLQQRVAFYSYGHVEGLVLDAWAPGWKNRYLTEMMSTESYFARE